MTDPNLPGSPPRKSSFGCLKILAILAGIVAILLIAVGIIVWQSYSWARNAPEPKIAAYPPLQLSDGEKEDVARIVGKLSTAKANSALVDEYVSPEVFNGVVEKLVELDRKKKKATDEPGRVRVGFSGPDLELKSSIPVKDPNALQPEYVNTDIILDCEIEDGKFKTLALKQFLVHDQPPPLLARLLIDGTVSGLLQNGKVTITQNGQPQKNPLEGLKSVKLLKREGSKLHIILDGSKFPDDNADAKSGKATNSGGKPGEKKTKTGGAEADENQSKSF